MVKGRSPGPWIQCSGFQGDASWPHSCCYLADAHGWSHPLIPAEHRPLILCHTLLPACWFSDPPPSSDPHHLILSCLHGRPTSPWLIIQILGISESPGKVKPQQHSTLSVVHPSLVPFSLLNPFPVEWAHTSVYFTLISASLSLFLPTVLWGL